MAAAQEGLGVAEHVLERRRIRRIDGAQAVLDDPRIDPVAGDVLLGQGDQVLAHPRDRAQRGVHDLVDGHGEAEVTRGQLPRPLELDHVVDDQQELGLAGEREREVVARQGLLRELAGHEPRLHAEQQGRQHGHDLSEQHGGVDAELAGRRPELVVDGEAAGRQLAEPGGQPFEHRGQAVEGGVGPLGPGDHPGRGRRRHQPGLLRHEDLGRPHQLGQLGLGLRPLARGQLGSTGLGVGIALGLGGEAAEDEHAEPARRVVTATDEAT